MRLNGLGLERTPTVLMKLIGGITKDLAFNPGQQFKYYFKLNTTFKQANKFNKCMCDRSITVHMTVDSTLQITVQSVEILAC